MRVTTRRLTGATTVAVLMLALLGPATALAQDPPAVVDVSPLPGAAVESGADLSARVVGDVDAADVEVRVDGAAVPAAVDVDGDALVVAADLDGVAAGPRELTVVDTSTGDGRSWPVTVTDVRVERLAGADRHATAVEVSRDVHDDGAAPAAVLARSDDFADALAGGPLAVHLGGPLLLTRPDTLPAVTADELERVLADGATVHLLGGPDAIDPAVAEAVADLGLRVVRHAGGDRHATAAAVADRLPASDTVVVASGSRFPDALAASVPASRSGWPILLTTADMLPGATRDAVVGATRAVVVGGEVAVGAAVADQLEDVVDRVDRVAGPTRFGTAVAVAETFLPDAPEVAVASGRDFPDALGAATRAADRGAPLLLVEPDALPVETSTWLRGSAPGEAVVHGGPVAVAADVADAVRHAVVDGPDGPRVVAADPGSGATSTTIAPVTLTLDRPVVADGLVAGASLDGTELPAEARLSDDGRRVVVDPLSPGDLPLDEPRDVRVVVRARTADGAPLHHAHTFTLVDHRVFATVGTLELVEPSDAVEVVGYHQSNHEGAQQMAPAADGPRWLTMDSRGRRTASRTSADVVAAEDVEVVAPVTGTVVRAGTYVLYCDNTDNFVAIEPDGMPGIEVKLLHFRGLRVGPGDRVAAGETVIGDGPRRLPFESQVDEHSSTGHGPHVHLEVVDTSIPNVPNGGSGSDGC